MRAKSTMSIVLALIVVAGGLVYAACGTPLAGESTAQSSVVSTTTGTAAGHWEKEGVSLDWPSGWKSASVEEAMRWPLGRLLDSTLLFALDQGDTYPRVELVRLDLPPDKTLQTTVSLTRRACPTASRARFPYRPVPPLPPCSISRGRGLQVHLLDSVVPLMRDLGVEEQHISAMLVDNPRRFLTFDGPALQGAGGR